MEAKDLIGKWKSDGYNSVMYINEIEDNGVIKGIYSSETGVTAEYDLVGMTDPKPNTNPDSNTGTLPVAFSVSWRPKSDEIPEDPSFHWIAGFAGQMIKDKNNDNIITLTYLLIKPKPADDNYDSTVIFTEVFRRDD